MKIIVGLGNPGRRYTNTRHNLGFWVVDQLSNRWNLGVNCKKFQSVIGEGHFAGEKVLLVKPQTYMNLSGNAVIRVLEYWNVSYHDLLVIYDDLDLPQNVLRLRNKGSSGGHKGVASIIDSVATDVFARLRVGIGPRPENIPAADFVLARLGSSELESYNESIYKSAEAVEAWIKIGIDQAMNLYNCNKA